MMNLKSCEYEDGDGNDDADADNGLSGEEKQVAAKVTLPDF